MESQDFEMPSPKRQRTMSPSDVAVAQGDSAVVNKIDGDVVLPGRDGTTADTTGGNDMLDALMQHVEAESAPVGHDVIESVPKTTMQPAPEQPAQSSVEQAGREVKLNLQEAEPVPKSESAEAQPEGMQEDTTMHNSLEQAEYEPKAILQEAEPQREAASQGTEPVQSSEPAMEQPIPVHEDTAMIDGEPQTITPNTDSGEHVPTSITQPTDAAIAQVNAIPAGPGGIVPQEAPEWEVDSNPYDSDSSTDSSTDTSSDSSSDEDDDEADDYTLLDPYEQARILMADGGGDDDDDQAHNPNRPTTTNSLRTANEKLDPAPPKPDIKVTEDMPIEELGVIDVVLASELTLLIKANVSGEYRVLEGGSLLCLQDRRVVGVVAEPLGRVDQPLYVVRYATMEEMQNTFQPQPEDNTTDTTIKEAKPPYDVTSVKGTKIFYVPSHSTFVFTQPLKAMKGSDASNFHDEEVGDDEMEFSDDEAEAEHKRMIKLRRKGIDPASVPAGGRGRGANRSRGRGGMRGGMHAIPETNSSAYGNGSLEMNYGGEEGEIDGDAEGYTRLERPQQFANSGSNQQSFSAPPPPSFAHNSALSNNNNNRGFFRGRGGRGRGFNDRGGGRGNNRPYQSNPSHNGYQQNQYQQNPYQQPSFPETMPTPQQQAFMFSQMGMNMPQSYPPPPPPPSLSAQYGNQAQQTQFSPSPITTLPQGGFDFRFAGAYQQQQGRPQGQQGQQQQYQGSAAWNMNSEAVAQVQRHLEELRRQNGQNGQA